MKKLIVIAVIVIAAYLIGVESAKSRGKHYEDLRHQLERLWKEPGARKARRRWAKRMDKNVAALRKRLGA